MSSTSDDDDGSGFDVDEVETFSWSWNQAAGNATEDDTAADGEMSGSSDEEPWSADDLLSCFRATVKSELVGVVEKDFSAILKQKGIASSSHGSKWIVPQDVASAQAAAQAVGSAHSDVLETAQKYGLAVDDSVRVHSWKLVASYLVLGGAGVHLTALASLLLNYTAAKQVRREIGSSGAKESGSCGRIWQNGDFAYRCDNCGYDAPCAMCVECFAKSNHRGHDYRLIVVGGGCCDCGDPMSWRPQGNCSDHRGLECGVDYSSAMPVTWRAHFRAVMEAILQALACGYAQFEEDIASKDQRRLEERLVVLCGFLLDLLKEQLGDSFRRLVGELLWQLPPLTVPVRHPAVASMRQHGSKFRCILASLVRLDGYIPVGLQTASRNMYYQLMGDPWIKENFGSMYVSHYEWFVRELCRTAHTDASFGDRSLLTISTQFLHPAVMLSLSRQDSMIRQLWRALFAVTEEFVSGDGSIQSAHPLCSGRKFWYFVHDLCAVYSLHDCVWHFFEDIGALGPDTMSMLELMEAINPQKRELFEHVQLENNGLSFSFSLELDLMQRIDMSLLSAILDISSPASFNLSQILQLTRLLQRVVNSEAAAALWQSLGPAPGHCMSWGQRSAADRAPSSFHAIATRTATAILVASAYRFMSSPNSNRDHLEGMSLNIEGHDGEDVIDDEDAVDGDLKEMDEEDIEGDEPSEEDSDTRGGSGKKSFREKPEKNSSLSSSISTFQPSSQKKFKKTKKIKKNMNSGKDQENEKEMEEEKKNPDHLSAFQSAANPARHGMNGTEGNLFVDLVDRYEREGDEGRWLHTLLLQPAASCVRLSDQIQARMWVRNGTVMETQNRVYRHSKYVLHALDLCALQHVASAMHQRRPNGDGFVPEMLWHYGLLPADFQSPPSLDPADSLDTLTGEHVSALCDQFLICMLQIVRDRRVVGLAADWSSADPWAPFRDTVRRSLLHVLCLAPCIRSSLDAAVPSHVPEAVAHNLLGEILPQLAEFQEASRNRLGLYSLRPAHWVDFDPFYPQYDSREADAALERYRAYVVSLRDEDRPPQLLPCCPLPRLRPEPGSLRGLHSAILLSPTLLTLCTFRLQQSAASHRGRLAALHLLWLALQVDPARVAAAVPVISQTLNALTDSSLRPFILSCLRLLSTKPSTGGHTPEDSGASEAVAADEEAKRRKEYARARQARMMAMFSKAQQQFAQESPDAAATSGEGAAASEANASASSSTAATTALTHDLCVFCHSEASASEPLCLLTHMARTSVLAASSACSRRRGNDLVAHANSHGPVLSPVSSNGPLNSTIRVPMAAQSGTNGGANAGVNSWTTSTSPPSVAFPPLSSPRPASDDDTDSQHSQRGQDSISSRYDADPTSEGTDIFMRSLGLTGGRGSRSRRAMASDSAHPDEPAEAWQSVLSLNALEHTSVPIMRSCGHYAHGSCLEGYILATTRAPDDAGARARIGEYSCPLCRRLCNTALPSPPLSGASLALALGLPIPSLRGRAFMRSRKIASSEKSRSLPKKKKSKSSPRPSSFSSSPATTTTTNSKHSSHKKHHHSRSNATSNGSLLVAGAGGGIGSSDSVVTGGGGLLSAEELGGKESHSKKESLMMMEEVVNVVHEDGDEWTNGDDEAEEEDVSNSMSSWWRYLADAPQRSLLVRQVSGNIGTGVEEGPWLDAVVRHTQPAARLLFALLATHSNTGAALPATSLAATEQPTPATAPLYPSLAAALTSTFASLELAHRSEYNVPAVFAQVDGGPTPSPACEFNRDGYAAASLLGRAAGRATLLRVCVGLLRRWHPAAIARPWKTAYEGHHELSPESELWRILAPALAVAAARAAPAKLRVPEPTHPAAKLEPCPPPEEEASRAPSVFAAIRRWLLSSSVIRQAQQRFGDMDPVDSSSDAANAASSSTFGANLSQHDTSHDANELHVHSEDSQQTLGAAIPVSSLSTSSATAAGMGSGVALASANSGSVLASAGGGASTTNLAGGLLQTGGGVPTSGSSAGGSSASNSAGPAPFFSLTSTSSGGGGGVTSSSTSAASVGSHAHHSLSAPLLGGIGRRVSSNAGGASASPNMSAVPHSSSPSSNNVASTGLPSPSSSRHRVSSAESGDSSGGESAPTSNTSSAEMFRNSSSRMVGNARRLLGIAQRNSPANAAAASAADTVSGPSSSTPSASSSSSGGSDKSGSASGPLGSGAMGTGSGGGGGVQGYSGSSGGGSGGAGGGGPGSGFSASGSQVMSSNLTGAGVSVTGNLSGGAGGAGGGGHGGISGGSGPLGGGGGSGGGMSVSTGSFPSASSSSSTGSSRLEQALRSLRRGAERATAGRSEQLSQTTESSLQTPTSPDLSRDSASRRGGGSGGSARGSRGSYRGGNGRSIEATTGGRGRGRGGGIGISEEREVSRERMGGVGNPAAHAMVVDDVGTNSHEVESAEDTSIRDSEADRDASAADEVPSVTDEDEAPLTFRSDVMGSTLSMSSRRTGASVHRRRALLAVDIFGVFMQMAFVSILGAAPEDAEFQPPSSSMPPPATELLPSLRTLYAAALFQALLASALSPDEHVLAEMPGVDDPGAAVVAEELLERLLKLLIDSGAPSAVIAGLDRNRHSMAWRLRARAALESRVVVFLRSVSAFIEALRLALGCAPLDPTESMDGMELSVYCRYLGLPRPLDALAQSMRAPEAQPFFRGWLRDLWAMTSSRAVEATSQLLYFRPLPPDSSRYLDMEVTRCGFFVPPLPFAYEFLPETVPALFFEHPFFMSTQRLKCRKCGTVPRAPALCLLCGEFMCYNTRCCMDQSSNLDETAVHAQHGNCAGVALLLRSTLLLVQRPPTGNRILYPSLWLDEFGESDVNMTRGRPLTLNYERYQKLRSMLLNHELYDEIHMTIHQV